MSKILTIDSSVNATRRHSGPVVSPATGHFVHGDYCPVKAAWYCRICDYFYAGAAHILSREHGDDVTVNLHRYFIDVLNGRKMRRGAKPELNLFTMLIFHGEEPLRNTANALHKAIWKQGSLLSAKRPYCITDSTASAIDAYRASMGDES